MITKNPPDFVGAVLGASEQNTKAILANAMGKVLIIDEVGQIPFFFPSQESNGSLQPYMLYDGAQSSQGPILLNRPLMTPSWLRYKAYQARIVVSFSSGIEIE